MIHLTPNSPEVKNLQPEKISIYLLQSGWKAVSHPHPNLQVFEGDVDDFGNPIQLVLPRRADLWDSSIAIAKAMNLLAVVEDRPLSSLVEDIERIAFSE